MAFITQSRISGGMIKIDLVREADNGDKEHLFDLGSNYQRTRPFHSNGADLQLHHLEHNRQIMEKYLEKNAI